MRKKIFGKKLSRGRKAREALFVSLTKALINHGKIMTTKAKAKAIQKDVDKLITLSKKDTLAAKRQVSSYLRNDRELTRLLFEKIGKAFGTRKSGFTRIILLPKRKGDSAEMARIEWVEKIVLVDEKPATKKEEAKGKKITKSEGKKVTKRAKAKSK
jgi:large subunit ribosomal protein L17